MVGSFWSLGAVFARSNSVTQSDISWFISAAILGGGILQYPIGLLSDRIDRRKVLLLLCVGGALTSLVVAASVGQSWHLVSVFLFGAMVMPIYAMSLATAADVAESSEFVQIGTSVLMLNAMIPISEQVPFAAAASEVAPASFDLDPRGSENSEEV